MLVDMEEINKDAADSKLRQRKSIVLKQRKQLMHAFKIGKLTNWNNNFAFNLFTLLYDALVVTCV